MSTKENQIAVFNQELHRETKELMAMSPESRYRYVVDIINSLANGIEHIARIEKRIPQAKAAERFLNELNINASTLIPPIMYMLKSEYQQVFSQFLERVQGAKKE